MRLADTDLRTRALAAHGDARQVHGRLHAATGGGAAEHAGVRLMASGIPAAPWNNADVHDVDVVDIDRLTSWYRPRNVPWGVRVPSGDPWPHREFEFLFRTRIMAVTADAFHPAEHDAVVEQAGPDDLEAVLDVDHGVFGGDRHLLRRWTVPHLHAAEVTVALVRQDGRPVATGYTITSDRWAGPAVHLAGLAVLPVARPGTAAGVSSWLLERAFSAGARLAHLHPDDDQEAAANSRSGFSEVAGLDVHVFTRHG